MIQNLQGTNIYIYIYIYIFKLFLPPVKKKKKKVYIYRHFQDLNSKKKKKKNHINNQIALQFFATCPSKFLIFMASELLGTKTEKYKTD